MRDLVLPTYNFNLTYAQKLAADVPDHPAFVLGHLAWASDNGLKVLGQEPALTAGWKELVIMGAKPLADRSRYPAKDVLLKALENAHARLASAVATVAPETFAQPAPERMRARFPTVGNMLVGLMTAHEASHLGQFSAWRRAMGFPPVF